MKRIIQLVLLFILIQATSFAQPGKKVVNRFFGIHFDFHAGTYSKELGKTLTDEMVDSFLTLVNPDYLQVDCKGHLGYSSYPTKVGTPAPGIIKDPLRIFRNVTAKHNVPLYVHYSGLFDSRAIELHPQWASINAKGVADKNNISLFSPYVDELMIPQFKELITDYKIDGAWVDGDCWAAQPDYGPAALDSFKAATGITTVPRGPQDAGYNEFMEYNRKKFRQYVAHYADAVHALDPHFLVTSNYAYSAMMPEKVDANIDFLSGDMASRSYVSSAAYPSRCFAPQGKPWDLMAWGFTHGGAADEATATYKTAVQIEQEAAQVLSMGGGFSIYYTQNGDASIRAWKIGTMAQVARFCRDRQAYTYGATAVPQIALLHSTEGYKKKAGSLYGDAGAYNNVQGILNALLDGQNTVEVLMEHSLQDKMKDYKLIVIPEWEYLSPDFIAKLHDYVNNGGNLLVIGSKAAKLFQQDLGVSFGALQPKKRIKLGYGDDIAELISTLQTVTPGNGTKTVGSFYAELDPRFPAGGVPATIATLGKGKIAAVYIDLGTNYQKRENPVISSFLTGLVQQLFPDPMVMVKGSSLVNVTINKLNNNYLVNLLNMAGPAGNENVYEYNEIPPIGPLTVSVALDKRPAKITMQPGNKPMEFTYDNGKATVTVPRLDIHAILVVEP